MQSRWRNPKQMAILRKLVGEGHSASQIARQLGCSRNSVIGKCHRLGLVLKGTHGPKSARRLADRLPTPAQTNWAAGSKGAPKLTDNQRKLIAEREQEHKVIKREARDFDATVRAVATLRAGECKFPHGDIGAADFRFCGEPANGNSYCEKHYTLTHTSTPRHRPRTTERRFP